MFLETWNSVKEELKKTATQKHNLYLQLERACISGANKLRNWVKIFSLPSKLRKKICRVRFWSIAFLCILSSLFHSPMMIHHEIAFHPLHVHCVRSHTGGQDLFYSRSATTSSHTSRHPNEKDNCIAIFEILGSFFICHCVLDKLKLHEGQKEQGSHSTRFWAKFSAAISDALLPILDQCLENSKLLQYFFHPCCLLVVLPSCTTTLFVVMMGFLSLSRGIMVTCASFMQFWLSFKLLLLFLTISSTSQKSNKRTMAKTITWETKRVG